MKPLLLFGARPNFMKIAPIYRRMRERASFDPYLVHTGQHFDKEMSSEFIRVLELPAPHVNLGVGSGSQTFQIAEVMKRLEPILLEVKPDLTLVVGDVNSTIAAALTSATLGIPVAHVEAGLRSRDWRMPEERNRVLTDRLSRFLFTPSADGDHNLRAEGIEADRIFQVGNVMIDTLDWVAERLPRDRIRERFGVAGRRFGLVTLHRPSNVDHKATLAGILRALNRIAEEVELLFPVHPRTRARMEEFGLKIESARIRQLAPLNYVDFIALMMDAAIILSDSGGVQEEATVVGTPCLTLRENTERPITLEFGANKLVGADPQEIMRESLDSLSQPRCEPRRPPLWDGKASDRIVEILEKWDAARR
jgi:UDP-N-acetylglucosamine 2-epimerase (non-hydrolysing)